MKTYKLIITFLILISVGSCKVNDNSVVTVSESPNPSETVEPTTTIETVEPTETPEVINNNANYNVEPIEGATYKDVEIDGLFTIKVLEDLPDDLKFVRSYVKKELGYNYFAIAATDGEHSALLYSIQYVFDSRYDDDSEWALFFPKEKAIKSIENEEVGKIYFWEGYSYTVDDFNDLGLRDQAPEIYKKVVMEGNEEELNKIKRYIILP